MAQKPIEPDPIIEAIYTVARALRPGAFAAGITGPPGSTFGWEDYNDAATSVTPIAVPAATWTTLPNDGLGPSTNTGYGPPGVSRLYDVSGNAIDTSELSVGDDIFVRPDFVITPSVNSSTVALRFALGTGGGSYTLPTFLPTLQDGAGNPHRFGLSTYYVYMGDTNTKDSPVSLQLYISDAASVVFNGLVIRADTK